MSDLFILPFQAMGSQCQCQIWAQDLGHAQALAAPAIAEIQRIEIKYSRYRDHSLLSRINAAAGLHAVEIDQETRELLDYADALFHASEGLFDISSGILRRAWDFQVARLPTSASLANLLKHVGWHKIQLSEREIYLPEKGMEIDLGGFGKEYAVDRAAAILLDQGVRAGLVDLGGDIRVLGPLPHRSGWPIAIQDPRQVDQRCAHIEVQQGALATSGDYERYFDFGGQRYCHILHPQTGFPVQYWRSVSILAPLCIAAGSFATIAMLKQAQAETWLKESGVRYLLVDPHGEIRRSE